MGDTFYPNGILHPFFGANRIFPPEHTDHFNFKLSPFQGTSLGMSIPMNGMDRGGGQGREKRMYSHEEQSQGQPDGVFSRGHSGTEMITNHLKLCVCMLCAAVCVHVDLSLVSSHFSKIDCTNACTAVYSLSIFVASDHAPFPLKRTSEYCCVVWRFRAHRCGMEMRSRKEVVNIVRVIWNHVPLQAHTVTLPRFATGRTPHWHTPW